jgi:site-specific recombinase XerD
MNKHYKKGASQITLNDFDATLLLDFLNYLELERKNTVRSRNLRLTAIHSFARYVALQCPPALNQMHQILAIPTKRYEKPLLGYLSREEMLAVLDAPDPGTWAGQRDRVMLRVLYNTGARVSELISVKVSDVEFSGCPSIRLHGKGRKLRTVPLWKETASMLRQWLRVQSLQADQPLIPNRHGMQMTRSNVSVRLMAATTTASEKVPTLRGRRITPHTCRHSTAMHMLQSGIDITVIALWLGHESPVTTHGYIEADLAMKERALASLAPKKKGTSRYCASDSLLNFLENL